MSDIYNPTGRKATFRIDGCNILNESGKVIRNQRGYLCTPYDKHRYVSVTGDYESPEITMNRNSDDSVIWSLNKPAHHKIAATEDSIYVLSFELRIFSGRRTKFDTFLKLSPSGEILDKWSSYENFDRLKELLGPLQPQFENKIEGGFYEYTHFNSFVVRRKHEGQDELIFSSRDQSSLLSLDMKTKEVRLIQKFTKFEGVHSLNLSGETLIFFANHIKDEGRSRNEGVSGAVYYDLAEKKVKRVVSNFGDYRAYSETRGSVFPLLNSQELLLSFSDGLMFIYSLPKDEILYRARIEIKNASKKPLEKVYEVSMEPYM